MKFPIKPVLKGTATTGIALVVIWQISIWAIFMIGIGATSMLFLAIIAAHVIGGYMAVNKLSGQSRLMYLFIGGLSGLIPIVLVALVLANSVSETGFDLWVIPVVPLVGMLASIAGSYLGSKSNFTNGNA